MLRDIFYICGPNLLSGLYFRLGINLVPESKRPVDMGGVQKVCVLAASGTGDLMTLRPMIMSLRRGIPDVQIIFVLSSHEAGDELEDGMADKVIALDEKRAFRKIRDEWPDLAIAAGSGFVYAKMAFRTGARYRLGFRYDHEDKRDTGFMFTHAVPMDTFKDKAEQKLDLIRLPGFF